MGNSQVKTAAEVAVELIETEPPLKVGILGGTFNPPHLGHLVIAEQVKETLQLDKILFLPTAEPPHSHKKTTIDAVHRINMLRMSIQGNDDFIIDLLEVEQGGKNYTVDTVRTLQQLYPTVEFYFIIGADMVEDLKNWHRVDELLELIPFIAVRREGYSMETEYPLITVTVPQIDISSSEIRKMVQAGQSIRYLVNEDVRFYIEQERLYQDGDN